MKFFFQIPQILSGIFSKQENVGNGALDMDDVVIFQIWQIITKLLFF